MYCGLTTHLSYQQHASTYISETCIPCQLVMVLRPMVCDMELLSSSRFHSLRPMQNYVDMPEDGCSMLRGYCRFIVHNMHIKIL